MKDFNFEDILFEHSEPKESSKDNDETPLIHIDDEFLEDMEVELRLSFTHSDEFPGEFKIFVYNENDLVLLPKYLKSLSDDEFNRAVIYLNYPIVDVAGHVIEWNPIPAPKELTDFINQKKEKEKELEENRFKGKIITKLSTTETFELFGHKIHGLSDLIAFSSGKKEQVGIYVYKNHEPYPIFDSSDFIYENRSYQLFFVRNHPLEPQEIRRLSFYPVGTSHLRAFRNISDFDLPAIYYFGDGKEMFLAERKSEPIE